jgi:hypothetical protein
MNLEQIENNIKELVGNLDKENFIYDFLWAYGLPKSSINRLKKGDYNKSKIDGEIIWNKKIYFKSVSVNEDVHDIIDEISKNSKIVKNKIRFIIVTDFKTFLSKDIKAKDTLDIDILELPKNLQFFLPLIGLEKAQIINESLADIKAAEKMGKLYDILIKDNKSFLENDKKKHGLNIFFTRILFCFFAEDTEIFKDGIFTKSIKSHTLDDGSDLKDYLEKLFNVLNLNKRDKLPEHYKVFPYVNGGLFKNFYDIPNFSKESRKIIIDTGSLDWSSINPDILGSMMQAIVNQGIRQEIGMHYTSVQNILKVIKPLFLDRLYEKFHQSSDNIKKLKSLLIEIYNLIIFDPACGSGNFLVISFKELSKLEIEIFKKLKELDKNEWLLMKSGIQLTQFYGIELDDYAQESAKLSLWIAQHQMNIFFKEIFDETRPTLPLTPSGNIYPGNATHLNWDKVCSVENNKKIFVVGNPPYAGSRTQNDSQRLDMKKVFENVKGYKNLDYISCWFLLAAKFIKNKKAEFCFVSTNSISQGEQVELLWPNIYKLNVEIGFAYPSFKWTNNAKNKAGVFCVIIGIRNLSDKEKFIFENEKILKTKFINSYLYASKDIIVSKINKPISNFPIMIRGNVPYDKGYLILNQKEKDELVSLNSNSEKFIKKLQGADEFINGIPRYCLWIKNNDLDEAKSIKEINNRIEKVKEFRLSRKDVAAIKLAEKPHQFREFNETKNYSIIIPSTTSVRRTYIPIGLIDNSIIITNAIHVLYDPPIYLLSVLCSKMHMLWVSIVGGKLKTDTRYSSKLCYNTFPFPKIDSEKKDYLENLSFKLVEEREKYSEKTMSELYDPDKMPLGLKDIHDQIDNYIEKIYGSIKLKSDKDRINLLFSMYESLLNKDNLF